MSSPKEIRNQRLAERIMRSLDRRHFESYYCADFVSLRDCVFSLIPAGSSISWGGSMSIRESGLTAALKSSGEYVVYDRDDVTTVEDRVGIYRKAFECDFYLSSVNGMSEDGVLVNIDGNGNRVAAITWGPRRVIFVVGLNKVVGSVSDAIMRARRIAAPTNAARFDIGTPCRMDGVCHDCHSPECICNCIHLLRNSYPSRRHIVILVGVDLGY